MWKKLRDLNLGTVSGVITVKQDFPLHRALQYFIDHRVSALPVVDSEGRLVDIYAKFDVIVSDYHEFARAHTYPSVHLHTDAALCVCVCACLFARVCVCMYVWASVYKIRVEEDCDAYVYPLLLTHSAVLMMHTHNSVARILPA
ncbi:putative 5'-AMP-activated protein kinase subunit gamma-2 [Fasciola gigantica]|uniref:Putative 5'-AMP-activated protein kinase subunit gamma-2 n=1 Tax=Fasciola gigantica TaxID=46835 RepID=A0A504YBC3_FASGI|nr:putative 5'-AMP-activated protein kinase subunit gamma-2 [Fasciola gigantica]